MSWDRKTEFVTIMFEFDITSLEGNPFKVETPFGKPVIIGLGDIFEQRDELEERVHELEAIVQP